MQQQYYHSQGIHIRINRFIRRKLHQRIQLFRWRKVYLRLVIDRRERFTEDKVMISEEQKKALQQRLRRIEGQVRGVQKMIEEDRDCREIAQQLQAIRSAVKSTNQDLIHTYLKECVPQNEVSDLKLAEITHIFSYLD